MPLIRGHHSFDDHFTQIPNDWLRDKNISLGAKGLLAQLLSHSPGWRISQESLARDNGIGRDAIRTLINELLQAGYLMRSEERERTDKGYLGGYTYTTQDPTQDNPTQDNPLHKNNNLKKNNLKNNERIYSDSLENDFDEFWKVYPKKVDKGAALRAFRRAIKNTEVSQVIDGAKRYAEDPNLPEKQYIKNPSTWLNAEAWSNPPLPKRKSNDNKKAIEEWLND